MAEHAEGGNPYRVYRVTWIILLIITVLMLLAERVHAPRVVLVLFLLVFMVVKAAFITGNFMHLRFEHSNLVVVVAAGIMVTSLILYAFITPESFHVLRRSFDH